MVPTKSVKLARLPFIVAAFKGGDPVSFLNGLVSNTLDAPHNAFLNLHGRIVAAFSAVEKSPGEVWIVFHEDYASALKDHLEKYLKLGGVSFEILDWCVYYDCNGTFAFDDNDVTIPQRAGRLVLSRRDFPSLMLIKDFVLFRLQNHVPLHGIDFMDEMVLNVGYEFVSLTKGCYLGQEFVAKVHSRSKPTWKIVVKNEEECSPEEKAKMTSKAVDPASGKTLGFVFVKNE